MPGKFVAPKGMMLCEGKGNNCGKTHYDGSKGGPRPTDVLVCSTPGTCASDECECKLCYTIKFKDHADTYLFLPFTPRPERNSVEEIEKDERAAAKQFHLVIEKFDWQCFCLKDKPITGRP
jgi:hypothetical protein